MPELRHLLDHLVGTGKKRNWDGDAQCVRFGSRHCHAPADGLLAMS